MSLKIGVLISGNGTNLQALIDDSKKDQNRVYEVTLVISNRKEAYGLKRAEAAGIPAHVIESERSSSREEFEESLIKILSDYGVGLVVLAGFMRILSPPFVHHYKNRILNIHPALLPAFPGTKAIEKAWRSKVGETGVTVHFVDEGVDTGPILLQERVAILKGESLEGLTERIHEVEHRLYPQAIRLYAKRSLHA